MLNARERLREGIGNKDMGSSSLRMSRVITTTIDLPVRSRQTTRSFGTSHSNPTPPELHTTESDFNLTDKVRKAPDTCAECAELMTHRSYRKIRALGSEYQQIRTTIPMI